MDLFASQESSQWFSGSLVLYKFPGNSGHRCIRPSVAEHETVRVSTSQADSGFPMQGEGERCPSLTHSPILALPDVVFRADSSSVSAPLGDSDQAGPAFSASGQDLASSARDLESVGMANTESRALMSSLPVEVQETIASARAPAMRKLYSSKWGVFESWCLARAIDPVNCPVGPVLEFLQEKLTTGAAATTLKGLCRGHYSSERAWWGSPGKALDGLCIYAWRQAAETSTPYCSSFLGPVGRPRRSSGSPFWAPRVSSRTDPDS